MGTTMTKAMVPVLAAVALATPLAASAQEVQITGPLAGQPAVRHMRQYRLNRFFVTPSIGYTLQDEFARAMFFGGSLGYHFTDWLGVSLWGAGAPLDIDTDLTTQTASQGQTTDRNRLSVPIARDFPRQIGRLRWGLSLQALFVPLRGKLSFFQAGFVDTDLYVLAGIAIFGLDERAPVPAEGNPCAAPMPGGTVEGGACHQTQIARASRVAPAPMLGVGLSLYINQFIGVQLEWRAFPFSWNPSGTDESGLDADGNPGSGFPDGAIGEADGRTTFNHMFNVGVVVYLPAEVTITE